jgi:hypothetical protein
MCAWVTSTENPNDVGGRELVLFLAGIPLPEHPFVPALGLGVRVEILCSEIEERPLAVLPHVASVGHEFCLVIPVKAGEPQPGWVYAGSLTILEGSLHHVVHLKHVPHIFAVVRTHGVKTVVHVLQLLFIFTLEPVLENLPRFRVFGRAAWVELFKDCELVGEYLAFDSSGLCHGVRIAQH